MIRILIADDHAIIRKGLKEIVGDAEDIIVTGEASNGQEALQNVENDDFDMVVLDISMPGLNGIDVLKQLKKHNPTLPVLILSIYPEEQYAIRAFKAGADGYLTKESVPEELISAIHRVSRGKKYISDSLAEQFALNVEMDRDRPLHDMLSDREHQVLCMIGKGKRLKEIADELYLSEKTVSTYRTRILEKLNLRRNQELIIYAMRNNLVS